MKKVAIAFFGILLVYFLGPTPSTPVYDETIPEVPSIEFLEEFIAQEESGFQIKPGNGAEIFWFDELNKKQTDVAIVYLHGFTASHEEGAPTHKVVAKAFGCNMYLARLDQHGIKTKEALIDYTADGSWESAKTALEVGRRLGKEVILMSTSTGGTLALKLAATYPDVKALINYSPNIEINDPAAFLLNDPWGLQIARIVFDGDYRELEADDEYRKYWYAKYRLESIVQLQELVETAATKQVFEKVTCPVFNGVYYKDEENQDEVIRVSAVREMHESLGTNNHQKVLAEFPNADSHVIAYSDRSGSTEEIQRATINFMKDILSMKEVVD
ncbi:MAG: alpha/beta hydrolase [Flavobacteriales bacterium]|nr:alpha/beta hydrolase [Flavobacteriales bacterium]